MTAARSSGPEIEERVDALDEKLAHADIGGLTVQRPSGLPGRCDGSAANRVRAAEFAFPPAAGLRSLASGIQQ